MPPTDPILKRWWPTTQSLDLVEGSIGEVASALRVEVTRFVKPGALSENWECFRDLDAAFSAAPEFTNVPTFYVLLPTHSRWCVLWYNTFLCTGYSSLCWCLTKNHGLTTIHWSANDEWTTQQSGAAFEFRQLLHGQLRERIVQCTEEDGKWSFFASGETLPQEEPANYAARRKRDRLNEAQLIGLLDRVGARPWSADFYAVPDTACFVLRRPEFPDSIVRRPREAVLGAG